MTRFNCRDCGDPLSITDKRSHRHDVCDSCWDNRTMVVQAMNNGLLTHCDLQRIQRAMANGRGTAFGVIANILPVEGPRT